MSLRLRNHLNAPPGEFPYTQTIGIVKKFPKTPLIMEQAQKVANFRAGNNLPRASVGEALEDIDVYTCQRLGGQSAWCYQTDVNYTEAVPAARGPTPCHTCGQPT